ncbi:MAG: hypothetical protein EBX41_05060 [Chitinophagia bacterium]|nr:hypothetical protein [Chitinophagia bacterium]
MKHIHRSAILCLTAVFCCAYLSCFAQSNIVLNGAFEIHTGCPTIWDHVRDATYWDDLDTNYGAWGDSAFFAIGRDRNMEPFPEYCHFCGLSRSGGGAPVQAKGFQYPRSGAGMIGMVFFHDRYYYSSTINSAEWQNHLQGRLSNTLTAGRRYCVTFYVSRDS